MIAQGEHPAQRFDCSCKKDLRYRGSLGFDWCLI